MAETVDYAPFETTLSEPEAPAAPQPVTAEELARLHEPAPLDDWELAVHPLTFSLAPSGFRAQIDFTLDTYRGTTLAKVEAGEQPRRRDWWRRKAGR
jgi:hypothetical protein